MLSFISKIQSSGSLSKTDNHGCGYAEILTPRTSWTGMGGRYALLEGQMFLISQEASVELAPLSPEDLHSAQTWES